MKSQQTHTKEPWSVWPSVDGAVVTDDRFARHIAHVRGATPEWQADARLIAAAPDLLEALLEFENYKVWGDGDPVLNAIRAKTYAAIAKATT